MTANDGMVRLIGFIIVLLVAAGARAADLPVPAGPLPPDRPLFTAPQYRWAVKWFNLELAYWMASDVVTAIHTSDDRFEITAGEGWHALSFEERGRLLVDVSRAREIIGHTPYVRVRRGDRNETLARVAPEGVVLMVPSEGLFTYRVIADVSLDTTF